MLYRFCLRRFADLLRSRHALQYSRYWSMVRHSPTVDVKWVSLSNLKSLQFSEHSSENNPTTGNLSRADYEKITEDTLESLTEYFEKLVEEATHLKNPDVIYGDGVLTVQFGEPYGTYAINRQSPNLQIWLSSPTSGPKRYDFVNGQWIYRHDGVSLHSLLNEEISKILQHPVDFKSCSYSIPSKKE